MIDLKSAFDPEAFGRAGRAVVDALARSLHHAQDRSVPVLPVTPPSAMLEVWPGEFPRAASDPAPALESLLSEVAARSNHLHHPGYVGHQIAVPVPMAALVELANALLDNGMAVYEMGQVHTIMERRVIEFLAKVLGFGQGSGGVLTHGGSLGNLTALLSARQAMAGYDVWNEGQCEPMAVLVSDQAHYCVARAVQVMGWGSGGVQRVATDAGGSLDPEDLPRALERARAAGRRAIAVVASSCSTATGSFDPLDAMADFCAAAGLWLHVDGAHGASLALSRRHRPHLAGIERADSVVWDLHKMMGLPALNTAVLFRDGRRSYEAFAQEASYLFEPTSPDAQWFNLGQRTLECTKRGMGVTAYCMLQCLGTDWFEAHVDALMDCARRFEVMLRAAPDFELACPGQANILCFRHLPAPPLRDDALDDHQHALRHKVVAGGSHYLVQTRWRGRVWLRVALMNPLTTDGDLAELLDALRAHAAPVDP